MNTLIIICGANHSGTSAVAEMLMRNGANTGEMYDEKSEITPYPKYENKIFRNWCITKLGQNIAKEDAKQMFGSIPFINDETLVEMINRYCEIDYYPLILKYPKSALVLDFLPNAKIKMHIKIVFVMRNIIANMKSIKNKTGSDYQAVIHDISAIYQLVTRSAFPYPLFPVCVEVLNRDENCQHLLNFCNLPNRGYTVDTSRLQQAHDSIKIL